MTLRRGVKHGKIRIVHSLGIASIVEPSVVLDTIHSLGVE
jgi:hypothetical protein